MTQRVSREAQRSAAQVSMEPKHGCVRLRIGGVSLFDRAAALEPPQRNVER
eukprot:CAMPEP_0195023978 /NCGR_PEP_ID=MMETSP0326_2-20130528/44185_1 /TAXON_ID=2866 ORGANISM="Crypthecodinium cohnii, Strain Seligo" /NCGR_SAMPLE_ID=MMETSP0326_2 /ASSEMBLY_ACC=CAM_ASM_000348 /LENGTH=50 /DNA_ID=CAMNT_0040044561 /DNA_START=125 /DNA_END=273 /DNA_ORIENTATION=+